MKKPLAITDLTRMQRGCVCVAGYDSDRCCRRPVLSPPGLRETSLFAQGRPIIFPFAVVEYDWVCPRPQPPHTEDYLYNPAAIRFIRRVKDENRERLLRVSLFESVEAIFEQPIHDDWGFYVLEGCGPRSIGTILPADIIEVKYEQEETGKWDYRLSFVDRHDRVYRLKITDLTWHYYCDSQRNENQTSEQVAAKLSQMLMGRQVYLRIGLARHWPKFPERCYLQVNAIHTFPDYLNGRTFADFQPTR